MSGEEKIVGRWAEVWTPIPPHLMLKTSTNPLGMTEFDPVIRLVDAESGQMEHWR